MKKPFQETEKGIQQAIENYLKYKGYYTMRLNSGKFLVGKTMVRGQERGTPDLMAFNRALQSGLVHLLFIEVKRPGKHPTYLQEQKMKELETYGARCIVAHSVSELEELGI